MNAPGGRPVSSAFQLAPPFVVLKMAVTKGLRLGIRPVLLVSTAYSVDGLSGSISSLLTDPSGKPLFASIQLTPPFVLLRTPRFVPAYNVEEFLGSITSAGADRMLLTILQVPPESVLLKRREEGAAPPGPPEVCA
jgi:hypothetical protein